MAYRPPRWLRRILMAAVALFTALGLLATALTPLLATRHPTLLLALESPARNLLLTRQLDLLPYLGIATLRRSGAAFVFYLLGRWYGDDAVRWLERKSGGRSNGLVRRVEGAVRGAAYPMVFFLPETLVSVLAGSIGVPPVAFAAVSVAGSVTITLLVRMLGTALSRPLDVLMAFLRQHVVAATVALALVVVAGAAIQWWRRRKSGGGPPLALEGFDRDDRRADAPPAVPADAPTRAWCGTRAPQS